MPKSWAICQTFKIDMSEDFSPHKNKKPVKLSLDFGVLKTFTGIHMQKN